LTRLCPHALRAPGALDASFDADGKVLTHFYAFGHAFAVAIQPDGRIVAAGFSTAGVAVDFALARYLAR
jgi:hypothetical protein